MKISTILIICVLTVGVLAQDSDSESNPQVADLGWMAGCWAQQGKDDNNFISEIWTKPLGMMLGTNRTVRDGKVKAFEYMRIESRDGGVYFVAKPSGAAGETSFTLISIKKKKALFENKAHDFPKRVIYYKNGDDLGARVEDDKSGLEFLFKKTACDE